MSLSRLRVRLAIWFAIAFLVGLSVLDLALYLYLRVEASHRLTADLRRTTEELARAVRQEFSEAPERGLAAASHEALREWPAAGDGYVVMDSAGTILVESGPSIWLNASRRLPVTDEVTDFSGGPHDPIRRIVLRVDQSPRFTSAVIGSSKAIVQQSETLAFWLGLSTPLVLLLGLGGGYVLSRRALAPVDQLRDAIGEISPTSLGSRLMVAPVPDELDRVAVQFNSLLDRLEASQQQNRQFLRQAAHQIRTPLTIVMGEASLELQGEPSRSTPVLRRIRVAADQMQRRVNDLFLLAEARAGGVPPLDELVEIDGLLLEAADVMRGRAHLLGRRLELGTVHPGTVQGSRPLLQEALVELIENGLRHGGTESAVALSALAYDGVVRVTVASGGPPLDALTANDPSEPESEHGLGVTIVQWIAGLHGGVLEVGRVESINQVTLVLPAAALPHQGEARS